MSAARKDVNGKGGISVFGAVGKLALVNGAS